MWTWFHDYEIKVEVDIIFFKLPEMHKLIIQPKKTNELHSFVSWASRNPCEDIKYFRFAKKLWHYLTN